MDSSSSTFNHTLLASSPPRRALRLFALAFFALFLLALAAFFLDSGSYLAPAPITVRNDADSGPKLGEYSWTNQMLAWQHGAFHFQPVKNYMNDPSAPMYYNGWYHLFYNHNPRAAYWEKIVWGHGVSQDLVNWIHLPIALVPEHWYDIDGIWSGSAVTLADGRVIILYTGCTNTMSNEMISQVVNLAVPANASDPFLIDWVKYEHNPVLQPPPFINLIDFRDPNPIWYNATDGTYFMVVGSKDARIQHRGIALVFTTKDFINFTLLPGVLHSVPMGGMWECVELYPVATQGPKINQGLDTLGEPEEHVKHVLKVGINDEWHDYYALGTYDPAANKWTPDDESLDLGIGLRYDWGKFYASRTFYDPAKKRRVLWGYDGETDTREADIQKGWASFQAIPRTILFDVKTGSNLLLWPIEEIESLRTNRKDFSDITVGAGSTVQLDVGDANQLDIEVEFEFSALNLDDLIEADVTFNCSASNGAATRGALGPFGLLTLANQDLTEQTATYFYVTRGIDGSIISHFCQDELRSSKANDNLNRVVGGPVPVLDGELFSIRILVDHSIVESFAQRGRACATSRAYPTEAIYDATRVFLFNNATEAIVTAKSVKVWHMNAAHNRVYDSSDSSSMKETGSPVEGNIKNETSANWLGIF